MTCEQLSKTKIGEILGKDNEYSISLLEHFVHKINYKGMPIDEALRLFCSRFVMPGESQMVYRILQRFANQYCNNNFEGALERDDAHTMSYAIIMLNVDAHSDKVKHKMTREQFVRMNRDSP